MDKNNKPQGDTHTYHYWDKQRTGLITTHPQSVKKEPQRKYAFWLDEFGNIAIEQFDVKETMFYNYDKSQRLKTVKLPDGTTRKYQYNDFDQLTSLITDIGTFSWIYDEWNRLKKIQYPEGYSTTIQRYPVGWIKKITHKQGEKVIIEYAYQRNTSGDVTVETRKYKDAVFERYFGYDAFERLNYEKYGLMELRYQYDAFGRRLELKVNDDKQIYHYDEFRQLRAIESSKSGVLKEFQFDRHGRLKMKRDKRHNIKLQYDSWQRPTQMIMKPKGESESTVRLIQDSHGNIFEVVSPRNRSKFFYGDGKQVMEKTWSSTTGKEKITKYIHAGNLLGGTTQEESVNPWIAFNDKIHSTICIQSLNSDKMSYIDYMSFGGNLFCDAFDKDALVFGNALNPLKDHTLMKQADLIQLGDRILDTSIGQFTTPNPMESLNPEHLMESTYAYA